MSKYLLILADQIDNTQRNLIQQVVKNNADDWWHEFLDAWIVSTDKKARWWRDELKVIFGAPGSSFMVLTLPRPGAGEWSSYMAPKKSKWIKENIWRPALPAGKPVDE